MAERPKLLYVIVHDEIGENVDQDWSQRKRLPSSRYTRAALQSTLQFMGCKARHAFKISVRVFEVLRDVPPSKVFEYHGHPVEQEDSSREKEELSSFSLRKPPKPSKKRSMVVISREQFLDVVCDALAQYKYVGPNQRADLMLACRFRERKSSVTVLLCGTSGCGKSTLSSLLASRLGITTVVSTDSIRHMMRSFSDQKQNPLLWASTYHAGEFLDPVAVKEATARRKLSISASGSIPLEEKEMMIPEPAAPAVASPEEKEKEKEQEQQQQDVSSRAMVVQGFKAQCEMVIDSLDRLITSWEQKNESVVVEGVHLSLNFVMGLMRKHPSIIPFMIYISNEEKHLERFAVRAKYMTLDPSKNKYAKYIRNIRTIQEYLCKRADKHLVPKINNTNVDKSVAGIHATIFSCLRRKESGEALYDPATNTVKVVEQEFQNQYSASSSLGSKCMFQLIQRNGSSHHLMALMNVDGSVAKAWHIDSSSEDVGKLCSSGCSKAGNGSVSPVVYGPIRIGRTGPVHLQFGNFGLSAFPSETGETSSSGGDGSSSSKVDSHELNNNNNTSTSSRSSLSSSSPRHVEAEKEAVDETAVFVSAEDPEEDNFSVVDSDEELADENEEHLQEEEIEGSVSESSVRSDEEFEFIEEGLADNEDGYWSEEEKKKSSEEKLLENEQQLEEVQQRFEVAAADDFSPRREIDLFKVSPLHQKSTNIPPVVVVPCAKQLHSRTKSLPVLGALKG